MSTLHSTITGADNHEPKGVESASSGQVYRANGSGSGTWSSVPAAEVSVADPYNVITASDVEAALYELYQVENLIEGQFASAASAETILMPVPFSCKVVSITFILGGSITTGSPIITVTRSDGAAMGTQTIAFSGSAEGTGFTFVPSGNDVFTSPTHRYIKLVNAPNSAAGAQKIYVQARVKKV